MLEFEIRNHLDEIAEVFEGMDREYENLVKSFHNVYLDQTRTDEYKSQERAKTRNSIYDLVADRVRAAKELVEDIKGRYIPEDEPVTDPAQGLYNLTYWKEILPAADYDELEQYYTENHNDPAFRKLLESELKKRESRETETFNRTRQDRLVGLMNQGPDFSELNEMVKALNFFASAARNTYPVGVADYIRSGKQGLGQKNLRTIKDDLSRHPIEDQGRGIPYRPAFSLNNTYSTADRG